MPVYTPLKVGPDIFQASTVTLSAPHIRYDHISGVYFLTMALDGHYVAAIVDTGAKFTVMSRSMYNASNIEAPLEDYIPQYGHGASGETLSLVKGFTSEMSAGDEPDLFTCTMHVRVTEPDERVGFDFVLENDFLRVYALYAPVSERMAFKQMTSPPTSSTSCRAKQRLFE